MSEFDPIDDETIIGFLLFVLLYCLAILSIVGCLAVLVYTLVF